MSEESIMENDPIVAHRNGGERNGSERRLAAIERDVAVVRSNYATREDVVRLESKVQDRLARLENTMSEMENRMVRWFFATTVSLAAVAFTAAKFL